MNAERYFVQTFLGIVNCRLVLFDDWQTAVSAVLSGVKKVTVEKGVVPRGLSQPRAGRPLRGNAVCLEPLLAAVAVIACLTDTATG